MDLFRGRPQLFICIASLTSLLSSCGPSRTPGPEVTRADSAGIEVVSLTGPGHTLDWEVVEEWRVGGAGGDGALFSFLHGSLVETDAEGRAFVLDGRAGHVAVFDDQGRHLMNIGREGEGPGEFRRAANMSVAQDGSVSVWDFGKAGLIRFSPDGRYRDFLQPRIRYQGPLLEAFDSAVTFTQMSMAEGGGIETALVRVDGESTTTFTSMTRPQAAPVPVPGCQVQIPVAPIFSPAMVWDSEGEWTATSSDQAYEIDLFRGHQLVQKVRWDLPLREVTRELAIQELGDGFTIGLSSGPCTAPAEDMVNVQGYAEYIQAIRGLKLSPQGEVWVERGAVRGEPSIIDVFSNGEYLGTLRSGFPLPAAFPSTDRILAVERDEFDVPFLVSYRLERGAG